MNEDLRRIGDALEASIARQIAASADEGDAGRNNVVSLRHVPVDHANRPEEATVSTTTPTQHPTSLEPAGRRPMSRRRVALIAAVATLGVGGAAAAAAVRLSSDEVSRGLPGGSAIFEGTGPTCTSTADDVFHCTLASAPTVEALDDYTGTLETFVDDTSHVAGGCIGNTADGLDWTCYAGQLAVDQGIIGPDLLGQLQDGPSHG